MNLDHTLNEGALSNKLKFCIAAFASVSLCWAALMYGKTTALAATLTYEKPVISRSNSSTVAEILPKAAGRSISSVPLSAGQPTNTNCTQPANVIVAENCQPGTNQWLVTKYQNDIDGFASPSSLVAGETVKFYVKTTAPKYKILIFRSGYYGGTGGRLMQTIDDVPGQVQPDCSAEISTGLITCSTWLVSAQITIPSNWVSGVYEVKLVRPDTQGENYMLFTVRDDQRKAAILYQQSLFTYQAYNQYGGKAVYTSLSSGCPTVADTPRAVKVSFSRPYKFATNMTESDGANSYFIAEYPMVRWLESQGYDVSYSTSLDTHRSGEKGAINKLLDHRVFLSVGHDEYWTQEMDDAITAARDAGVHIGFFSANTSYWRVRLEPDPVTHESDGVMVVYKTTESGAADPSGFPTTTWRDPNGVNNPENGLVGSEYIGDDESAYFPLRVLAEQGKDEIYRHTGLQDMPSGTFIDIGKDLVGWEWNAVVDNGHSPPGLVTLASSPVYGFLLKDPGNFNVGEVGKATAHTTRYIAASKAIVFSTGTILWSWGLGAEGVTTVAPNPYIEQITYNVLADMGVQPGTPTNDIVLDGSVGTIQADHSFGSVEEDQQGLPAISNISATVNGQQVTVDWDTDIDTTGVVWVGDAAGHVIYSTLALGGAYSTLTELGVSNIVQTYSKHHEVILTLPLDIVQYYRIVAVAHQGKTSISDENTFNTIPASLFTRVRYAVNISGRISAVKCWIQDNPSTAEGISAVIVVAFIGLLLGMMRIMNNRRMRHLKGTA